MNALTLLERRDLSRRHNRGTERDKADRSKGKWHFKKWNEQQPFGNPEILKQRLATDDLTLSEFKEILSLSPDQLAAMQPELPDWLKYLKNAYENFSNSTDNLAEQINSNPVLGFYYLSKPLTDFTFSRFEDQCTRLLKRFPKVPLNPTKTRVLFQENLYLLLLRTMSKTLILELNCARVKGTLKGGDSQARFKSFIADLKNPKVSLNLLKEYPVLARKLSEYALSWYQTRLELVERLCEDWSQILEKFSPNQQPGLLIEADITGDRHRDGRSVAILGFESGLKIVYKPRDMGLDRQFANLLKWLGGKSPIGLKPLKIIDKTDYGWAEFIAYQSCQNKTEVARFYRRMGGLLALLYVLEASDFHYENLIANGDLPHLVDLESFFTPYFPTKREGAVSMVGKAMMDSVLQTGLLPWRIFIGKKDKTGMEISGLSQTKGTASARPAPFWTGGGSDEMRLTFKRPPLKDAQNRPTINGKEVSMLDYAPEFIEGFREIYDLLWENKAELMGEKGPLSGFNQECRVLFRMTLGYSYLLTESYHPDKLRDGLTQDRHWDGLWMGIEKQPLIRRLFPAERDSLSKGDIPMFTCLPESRDIFWPGGSCKDVFMDFSLNRVKNKFKKLSPEDKAMQVWLIKGSLATMRADGAKETVYQLTPGRKPSEPQPLVDMALKIAERLEETVANQDGESNWVNLCFKGETGYHLMPMGIDLYSGLPGQAMFYCYLAEITGREAFRERGRSVLKSLLSLRTKITQKWQKEEALNEFGIGMFSGFSGIVYALTHAGSLWSNAEMLDEARELIMWMAPAISRDRSYDLVLGSAGLIAATLALYEVCPSDPLMDIAIRCGDHLIDHSQKFGRNMAWRGETKRALTGFAHGTAGFAYILAWLGAQSGEHRFTRASRKALGFERSHFHPSDGWEDLRQFQGEDFQHQGGASMCAWCNGAAGIGLARTAMAPFFGDDRLLEEVNFALKQTEQRGFGRSHSLCHGDFGNAELFLAAGMGFHRPDWVEKAGCLATGILASIEQHGWLCGVPNHFEALGLMTGITGIGYGCLRLAYPQKIPSILLLEGPNPKNENTAKQRSQGKGLKFPLKTASV